MPTGLGKIPAGKDGIFSASWGSRRIRHAHCAVGLRMSWTCALTMPRPALLTPFPQVSSWASASLAFAHPLKTLLGDGTRAFLTYPVLYGPRVGLSQEPIPRVLLRAPGEARPHFPTL